MIRSFGLLIPALALPLVFGLGIATWRYYGGAPSSQELRESVGRGANPVPLVDPENPCGPVSVALVSHLLGNPVSLETARRIVVTDAVGRTSASALSEGLKTLGFHVAAVRIPVERAPPLDLPLIAFLRDSHFAVLVPMGDHEMLLLDPPHEAAERSVKQLSSIWKGEAILVGRNEESIASALKQLGIPMAQ